MNDIADPAALRAHIGAVSPMAARKVLPKLDRHCRRFEPIDRRPPEDADQKIGRSYRDRFY